MRGERKSDRGSLEKFLAPKNETQKYGFSSFWAGAVPGCDAWYRGAVL